MQVHPSVLVAVVPWWSRAPYFRLLESDFRFPSVFFSWNPVFGSHRCFGFPAVFSVPAGKVFSVPRVFVVPSGAALQFPLKALRCPLRFFWFPEGFGVPAWVFSVPAPGGRERHSPGAIDSAHDRFSVPAFGWLTDLGFYL